MTVVDGDGTTLLAKTCGSWSTFSVPSRTNRVWIYFHSDSSVTKKGFSATWTSVGSLEANSGKYRTEATQPDLIRQPPFWTINFPIFAIKSKITISLCSVSELIVGLLSGGRTRSSAGWSPMSSVEIFGGDCTVADLPQPRSYHVSFVTPDDRVMVCGGLEGWSQSNSASCLEYNLNSNAWRHHSYLRAKREKAVSVSFPSGVLVLGGQNVRENYYTVPAWSTSDYLA